ncbi:MAG: TetR/AcrR family transcriptional regulator [Kiloniellales bacterium]|nr:TetR/AcrR family transcriptional regulator [Kiloniellales bacterium]
MMAQVKKQEVENAILDAAYGLFREKGYNSTSVAEIAQAAGVSPSNIYVYFCSKLEILYAIYDPWLRERLTALERELEAIGEPEERLRHVFRTLWHSIPAENNGFANNLMQALSSASNDEGYSRELLLWAENRISAMIRSSLPSKRRQLADESLLAHVIFMAFDGFVMNHGFHGPSRRIEAIIELMVSLLLGKLPAGTASPKSVG